MSPTELGLLWCLQTGLGGIKQPSERFSGFNVKFISRQCCEYCGVCRLSLGALRYHQTGLGALRCLQTGWGSIEVSLDWAGGIMVSPDRKTHAFTFLGKLDS